MDVATIEKALIEAAEYERRAPRVKAPGYNQFWPKMSPDPTDYGYQYLLLSQLVSVVSEVSEVAAPRKDIYDLVMLQWLSGTSPLNAAERKLIWERVRLGRGKLVNWREVGRKCGVSHEKARKDYIRALRELAEWTSSKDMLTTNHLLA